jgi:hypothetical protein
MMPVRWLLILAAMLSPQAASPLPPSQPASTQMPALDFEFFKARVQPIFLYKRAGRARCYVCHRGNGTGTSYLQVLRSGAATWDDDQAQKNFESVKRFVRPGDPMKSRLLTHPLKEEAGGDEFHGGGKHWASQSDPEWQTLAAWVKGATLAN